MLYFIEETSGKLRYFHIRCWQHQSSTPIILRYNWEVIENLSIISSKLPQLLRKTLPHHHWQPHTDLSEGSASYNSSAWESHSYRRKWAIFRICLFRRRAFVKHLAFWLKIWSTVGLKKISSVAEMNSCEFEARCLVPPVSLGGRASPLLTAFGLIFSRELIHHV